MSFNFRLVQIFLRRAANTLRLGALVGHTAKRDPTANEILQVQILRSSSEDRAAERDRVELEVEKQFQDIRRKAVEAETISESDLAGVLRSVD